MGFILGVPPNVAAVWFGPEQVSSACSIGVFGNQLGVALGFLLPPMMVGSHDGDIIAIGADLSQLFYILAGLSSGWLLDSYGDITCNGVLCSSLLVGFILTLLINPNLKRQQANRNAAAAAPI